MRKRKHINLSEKLAATLACILPQDQRDDLRSRKVAASEVLSLFQFDHISLHAFGGEDSWYNLDPKLVNPHREKSKLDTAIVAKAKRIDTKYPKWLKFDSPLPKPVKIKKKYQWPKRKFQARTAGDNKG